MGKDLSSGYRCDDREDPAPERSNSTSSPWISQLVNWSGLNGDCSLHTSDGRREELWSSSIQDCIKHGLEKVNQAIDAYV